MYSLGALLDGAFHFESLARANEQVLLRQKRKIFVLKWNIADLSVFNVVRSLAPTTPATFFSLSIAGGAKA